MPKETNRKTSGDPCVSLADAQLPKLNASESRIVAALEIRLAAILDDRMSKL